MTHDPQSTSLAFIYKSRVSPQLICPCCGKEPAEYRVETPKGRAKAMRVCWECKAMVDYSDDAERERAELVGNHQPHCQLRVHGNSCDCNRRKIV